MDIAACTEDGECVNDANDVKCDIDNSVCICDVTHTLAVEYVQQMVRKHVTLT